MGYQDHSKDEYGQYYHVAPKYYQRPKSIRPKPRTTPSTPVEPADFFIELNDKIGPTVRMLALNVMGQKNIHMIQYTTSVEMIMLALTALMRGENVAGGDNDEILLTYKADILNIYNAIEKQFPSDGTVETDNIILQWVRDSINLTLKPI